MDLNVSPERFVEENAVAIAVVGVFLVGTIGLVFSGYSVPGLPASVTGGLCGLSSNEVSFTSNHPDLQGKHWLVSAIAGDNCGGESITGGWTVPASDFQGTDPDTGQQVTGERDFTISMDGFQGFAYNELRSPNGVLYDVEHKAFSGSGIAGDITDAEVQACKEWQASNDVSNYQLDVPRADTQTGVMPYVHTTEGVFPDQTLHCYRAIKAGEVGEFQSSTYSDWTGTFVLTSGGTSLRETVTKAEAEGGFRLGSGDRSAFVKSVGSLTSDVLDVNLNVQRWQYAYDENENDYVVTTSNLVGEYTQNVNNFDQRAQEAVSNNNAGQAVDEHHLYVGNVLQGYSNNLEDSIGDWVANVEIDSNRLKIVGRDRYTLGNPVVLFRVAAEWVGFDINVAEPRIDSASDVTLQENSQRDTVVEVTNTGEVAGGIQVEADCSSPLRGDADRQTVASGETGIFNVPIRAGYSDNATYGCQIKASSTATGEVTDTTRINVEVTSEGGEPPGPPRTPEDEYQNGCIDGIDNDRDGLIDQADPDCEDDPTDGLPVTLIVAIAGFALLGGTAYYFREDLMEFVGGGR